MLIRRIILENFGLYGGRNEFDLVPRVKYGKTRPITLFGGKNGAGKTTILEAVRLALYGRTALGSRVRQADYDSHLRGRLHRARGDMLPVTQASVAIEFEYVRMGEKHTYLVERSWSPKGRSGVDEFFRLLVDGQADTHLEGETAEAFAREIVPEGLSQLFFFDGEKIRELAEDHTGDEVLADAIKALLGLDTVERLAADLNIYASRKTAELAGGEDQKRLDRIQKELGSLTDRMEEFEEEQASIDSSMEGVEAEIGQVEERLHAEGHGFASQRDDLKTQRSILREGIHRLEHDLRQLCDGPFPLALCPRTADRLKDQLEHEARARRQAQLMDEMSGLSTDLLARLSKLGKSRAQKTKAATTLLDKVTQDVRAFFEEHVAAYQGDEVDLYLDLSDDRAQAALGNINDATDRARPLVQRLCRELDKHNKDLNKVERQLNLIPADDAVKPIMEELQQFNQRLGGLKQRKKEVEDQLDALRLQQAELDRRRIRMEEAIADHGTVKQKLDRTRRVRAVLDEYLDRLTVQKIQHLRRSVVECYNRLAHKGDVLKDIQINPKTFQVNLFDQAGTQIPKSELSSGEKQIYAISMLWGLARTSGRPLPVIIDTPLGRLDSDHRMNLCKNYFPHASHQVILLSTDTEVDQKLFKELSPHISHSYHLEFNPDQVRTSASEAYFWKEPAHV